MKLRPEQFAAHLQREALAPAYLIFGAELLIVQELADQLRAVARQQGYAEREQFIVETGCDWAGFANMLNTLSLFASQRVIELRLGGQKLEAAGAEIVKNYLARPAQDQILLVIADKLDAAVQRSAWVRALESSGIVVQVWPVNSQQLPGWIQQRLRSRRLRADQQAVQLLAERTEGNLLALAQEIDKLQLLFDGQTLTADLLVSAIARSARYSVFDLADAVLAGHSRRVGRLLNGLTAEGLEPVLILWALQRELQLLLTLHQACASGRDLASALQQAKVWEKRKPLVSKALKRLSRSRCQQLLQHCAVLDQMIKGARKGNIQNALWALSMAMSGVVVPSELQMMPDDCH